MRSLLVVPADDLASAMATATDAVIVDLSGAPDASLLGTVTDVLLAAATNDLRPLVFIRLSAVDTPEADAMLAALMPGEPDGFVIGLCADGADVQQLGAKLAVHEAELDLADGQTGIIAEIGASARSVLRLDSFVDCSPRLLGLAWNPATFAAELDLEGPGAAPSAAARGLVVITARAAGVAAIEIGPECSDDDLRHAIARARVDGFNASAVRRPDQVPIVAAVFGA